MDTEWLFQGRKPLILKRKIRCISVPGRWRRRDPHGLNRGISRARSSLTNYDFEIDLNFALLDIPDRDVFDNVFLLMNAGYQTFESVSLIKNNPHFNFSGKLVSGL